MTRARTDIHWLISYGEIFHAEHGRWPDFAELVAQDAELPTTDPWGRRYLIEGDGGAAVVVSRGRDGERGTCDDVVSRVGRARPRGGRAAAGIASPVDR